MARVEVSVLYDVRNRVTVKREFHSVRVRFGGSIESRIMIRVCSTFRVRFKWG